MQWSSFDTGRRDALLEIIAGCGIIGVFASLGVALQHCFKLIH